MSRGKFITFEGIDGAGKSTQLALAHGLLDAQGHEPVLTREPGGTPLAEKLRELVLRESMSPEAEALLVFAARREHLERVIWPALEAGRWVLCDRFTDATFAYQGGGRGVARERIAALAEWVHPGFAPDLTLLFDLPVDVAAGRLARQSSLDRFEREREAFFARVRSTYLERARAEPARFVVVDSTLPRPTVAARVQAALARL